MAPKGIARIALLALLMVGLAPPAAARTVRDMAGRSVTVPDRIARVYAGAPPVTQIVHALAPETLVSFNATGSGSISNEDKPFLGARTASLPNIGNMMGHGMTADIEAVLTTKPDLVILWKNGFIDNGVTLTRFQAAKVPVILLQLDTLDDMRRAFLLLGDLLGRQARARTLAGHIAATRARVAKFVATIPPAKRMRVYYAESADGLATDCDRSFHARPIVDAGGANVYRCAQANVMGMERISLEQIIAFAPDVIVTFDTAFPARARADARWQKVRAVAANRFVIVPTLPFNWIDRPPCYMQAIGIPYLTSRFYPGRFRFDARTETAAFYKLFIQHEPTAAELDRILPP
ncbi:ABC transporter substrate-binding protein [soil metagenome]